MHAMAKNILYISVYSNVILVSMPKLDRTSLLKFLSKPRYVSEVAEHFQVSAELVNSHLREVVKGGQVLVSQKRVPQTFLNFRDKQQHLEGFLYVSEVSPLLTKGESGFKNKAERYTLKSKMDLVFMKYPPKTEGLARQKISKQVRLSPPFANAATTQFVEGHDNSAKGLISKVINSLPVRGKSIIPNLWKKRQEHEKSSLGGEVKTPSHIDELRLFQALLDQPLPFLDIRRRFAVSKRTVKSLVKRGVFEEVWGRGGIGVKFRLTEKGKGLLKELEAAAHLEPDQKNLFIRLKNLLFS